MDKNKMKLKGIIPALITPFTDEEEVDYNGLKVMLDYVVDGRTHSVFVTGSTGEAYALSIQEKIRIYEVAVEHINGKVPVGAGTGVNSTRDTLKLTKAAKEAGCDYVSIITPAFIKPSQEELYRHYATIADFVDIPILLYNNPDKTQNSFSVSLATRLAKERNNIVGIKDSSGNLSQFCSYIRECPKGFSVIMGRDSMIYAGLMHGGVGAICACANIVPSAAVSIYESYVNGDYAVALESQNKLARLRQAFNIGSFPAMIKEAVNMIGLPGGKPRKPIEPLSEEDRDKLRTILSIFNVEIK